jgi:hypothetical protein
VLKKRALAVDVRRIIARRYARWVVGEVAAALSRHWAQPCAWIGIGTRNAMDKTKTAAIRVFIDSYWKKANRIKRKSQKTPIACQYQAVQSTRICRVSS